MNYSIKLRNLLWRPYLDVCCVGEELQARRLPTGYIALHTDLAKDKCRLEPEIKPLGEYWEEFLQRGSGKQPNWFSARLQCAHKNPSAGNPQGPAVRNKETEPPLLGQAPGPPLRATRPLPSRTDPPLCQPLDHTQLAPCYPSSALPKLNPSDY